MGLKVEAAASKNNVKYSPTLLFKEVRFKPYTANKQNVESAAVVLDGRLRRDPASSAGGPGCDEAECREGPRERREAERLGEPGGAPAGGQQAVQCLGGRSEEEDVLGGHEDENHHWIHHRHCRNRHHHLGILLI